MSPTMQHKFVCALITTVCTLLTGYYFYSMDHNFIKQISTHNEDFKFWYHFNLTVNNIVKTHIIVHRFYLDDRTKENVNVRSFLLIAAKNPTYQPQCRLYFENSNVTIPGVLTPYYNMAFEGDNTWFFSFMLTCPIRDYWKVRTKLKYASLHGLEGAEKVPVIIPQRRTDGINDSIAVCLAAQYGKVTDKLYAPYIVQWVEMLRMLGVSKITWYNSTMISDGIYVNKVLNYYANTGMIKLIQLPLPVKYNKDKRFPGHFVPTGEAHAAELTRIPVTNDCFYRDIHKHWYFIHLDKDEIMIPYRKTQTYQSYIKSFIERQPNQNLKNRVLDAPTLAVTSAFFYLTNKKHRVEVPDHFPMLKYTYRQPTEPYNVTLAYSKPFLNPRTCNIFWNHRCFHGTHMYLPENEILIHHYRYKCYESVNRDVRHNGQNCDTEEKRHFEDVSIYMYADVLKKRTSDVLKMIKFIQ